MVGGFVAALVLLIVAVSVTILAGDGSSQHSDAASDPSDLASEPGRCEDMDRGNDISKQVRLTTTDEWIEFELWSIEPFPARALFPVVRIGSRDFSLSLWGDDGLNTLIFFIPPEEFDLLTPEDQVWVYYGGAGGPPPLDSVPDDSDPWSFGSFNRGLLDCQVLGN